MEHTYHKPSPSEEIVIIGENFITEHLFNNFKRYSNLKVHKFKSISEINRCPHYIMECSFNEKSQNDVLRYSIENNIKKVILLNHWKKPINDFNNLIIIQAVVPDVYGEEHNSFNRPGTGNSQELPISYCNLICEGIRRIHDAKYDFIPNLYISYGENTVKYLYVENLYEPIQYMIDNINETCELEIFDEQKNVGTILDIIKDVVEYRGNIVFEDNRTIFNKSIKKLPYKHQYRPLYNTIKDIYKYLIYNNERFMIQ